MTHVFDPEIYILSRFDVIQDEVMEKISKLRYYSGAAWDTGVDNYKMKNDEYKRFWVNKWKDHPKWLSHVIMAHGMWEQPGMELPKIINKIVKEMNWGCVFVGYSLLRSGGVIKPHRDEGVSEGWDNVWHLGISIPPDNCYITVDGKKMQWEEGRILKFDDSMEHSVVNNSEFDRIIIYMKFSKGADASS